MPSQAACLECYCHEDVSRQNIAGRLGFLIYSFETPCFPVDNFRRRRSRAFFAPQEGKMKKGQREKVLVVILVALAFLFSAGCRAGPRQGGKPGETRQVTDDLGRTVTIPMKVTRIVSLAPSLTENIFAVGAGDRLVGDT